MLSSVVCQVREEPDLKLWSWRFIDSEGAKSPLYSGDGHPKVGEDVDGLVVESIAKSLAIVAADLEEREGFDPRRVYLTESGTRVVFKRREGRGIVLWSFKTNAEIKIGASVVLTRSDAVAEPTAVSRKKLTQRILAAYLIAMNPGIKPEQLALLLRASFPTASIGRRHGSHYISQSRNGHLPEPPDTDPRTWIAEPELDASKTADALEDQEG